jgi:tetratricopeptide (TPR) repeat protein
LRLNIENLRARALKALVLRRLGREAEAAALLRETLVLDPLDWWARDILGEPLACYTQVRLDLALDYSRAGFHAEALAVLERASPEPHSGTAPLVHYYRAWVCHLLVDKRSERRALAAASRESPDWCFPARVEEIAILEHAITANPRDARVPFLLGNLLYDRRRHREAIALWRRAVRLEPSNAVAWRNLGIGAFNILHRPALARSAYETAFRANPRDARLLYERDQLWKRLGETPARRLRELERHFDLVAQRDDLSVELCALYNQTGRPHEALRIVNSRRFQPWEGGEGMALGQHVRTNLLLGRAALASGDVSAACARFLAALDAPENLGEARHLLANQSDVHFWIGEAFAAAGNRRRACEHWTKAATFRGDFQGMKVREFSEMTCYSALALQRVGRKREALKLLRDLLSYARGLARTPARIDYFATSLPTMLLFDDDLDARQQSTARFLEAQARLGLGERTSARKLLQQILRRDPNHALARDLMEELR